MARKTTAAFSNALSIAEYVYNRPEIPEESKIGLHHLKLKLVAAANFAWRMVHNHILMRHSVALDHLSKTIPPIDSDQRVALLHAPFKGTTVFGGELAKIYRANKERASYVTLYPAAPPQTYSTKPCTGRGKSFKKGSSSNRRGGRDRDQSRSTCSATVIKPSKSADGQATMIVTVPQESNKRKVQSNEGAYVQNLHVEAGSLGVIRNRQNEGMSPPPTIGASRGMTMPFCGGVEAYNERSLCVKYRSQEVQTSFHESTPSPQDPLGGTNSQGLTEDSGNARANIPDTSKERNLRYICRHSGFYSNVFLVRKASGEWCPVLKTTEQPHRRSSLSHAHHKFSAEYRRKRRLSV